jgi:hypothetical protein
MTWSSGPLPGPCGLGQWLHPASEGGCCQLKLDFNAATANETL